MRNFKIFLWIFCIFLIQTVIAARFNFFGSSVSVVIGYIICVMIFENEFRSAATISIICSAAAGALCGRDFIVTTLYYVYSSVAVFALRKKPVYAGNFIKTLMWTFVLSAGLEVVFYALGNLSVSVDMLLYDALPTAVINTVAAAVIYPILKKTMYKEEKKKLLIT